MRMRLSKLNTNEFGEIGLNEHLIVHTVFCFTFQYIGLSFFCLLHISV